MAAFELTVLGMAVLCFTALVISVHTIYNLCVKDSSHWIDPTYKNLTISIILLFTACSITDLMHILIDFSYENENIITVIADGFYFIADIMFYIVIILRIHVPFGLKRFTLCLLSFAIATFIVTAAIFCIGIFLFGDDDAYFNILYTVLICNDVI